VVSGAVLVSVSGYADEAFSSRTRLLLLRKFMSVHGTNRTWHDVRLESGTRLKADIGE
jgi:hypothetical protein